MKHQATPSPEGGNTFEELRSQAQFTASLAALSGMLRHRGKECARGIAAEQAPWDQTRQRKPLES
jgi:hypothetical protein